MDETQKAMSIVSIDIETLSTEPDGVILSIGACVVGTDKTFYRTCSPLHQVQDGRTILDSTAGWWLRQPEAFATLFLQCMNPAHSYILRICLRGLIEFIDIEAGEDCLIYTKGAMDIYMLENAFRQYNLEIPWKHWQVRDLRTLIEDAKIDVENLPFKNPDAHNALSDALYQAEIIELAREELNL